jgi:hypothetical protein
MMAEGQNGAGQGPGENNGRGDGQGGGRPEWAASLRHDTSRPLREIAPLPGVSTREDFEVKRGSPDAPGAPDTQIQDLPVAPLSAIGGVGFDGVGEGNAQFSYNVNHAPPDTVGEAGLTQFVQWVNPSFAIFDKATGNLLYGPAAGNTIWQGFGGDCETRNDGDPMVQYDQLADRWVMSQFSLRQGNYLQCVAVSKTSDATGQWHRYAFSYNHFPDYPKLAVWPDAYYMTFNMFGLTGGSFTGSRICAYDRLKMLDGLPATQICYQPSTTYHSFLASDLEGKTLPPAGSPNYVMTRSGTGGVNLFKFKPNFASPASSTFTGPTAIAVSAYTTACATCVPQPGTTQKLDTLGDRLMYRLSYRNLGSREALVVNHSVTANSVVGIRWYEFNVSNFNVTVRQQSTYAPNDGQYRWMGSAGTDKLGNIAVGFSIGSGSQKPSIRFAGRETTDPLSTLSIDTNLHTGTGSQLTNLSRWGDYSSMTVDPVDDCTFWYTSEYLQTNGTFNWSTRIGSFKFSSCAPAPAVTVDVLPASQTIAAGQSTTYTATLASQNGYSGSGNYSVTGLPSGATGTFSPTGFTSGSGSTTLTVTTTADTTPGTYQLTITAADTSNTPTDSENVTLVVNLPATFTLGAAPASQSVTQGQFVTYNVTLTAQNGYTGGGSFSVTGLPAGAQGLFSPDTYSNGNGSSQLTVATDATTAPGTYPFTVTATDTTGTPVKTANLTLVVNAAAPGGFSFSASPSTQPIAPNESAFFSAIVTAQNGYTGSGTFSVTGLPAGTSGSFSPAGYSGGGGNSILTITAGAGVAVGSYPLTVTATDSTGTPTHSSSVVLVVNPPASFTVGAQPSSRSVVQGQSTTFTASVTAQNGYEGSGSFSVTGLPAGAGGSFSPSGYSNGGGQSTLTVTTSGSTPVGTYPLTITATDTTGAPVNSTSVSLTVTSAAQPDFALAATPGTLVVKRGRSDSYNVTVTPSGGFNETVSLSVTGLPASTSASFSPSFLNGGGTSMLTITTDNPATPKGTFTLTITAQSMSKTRSITVTLKVN